MRSLLLFSLLALVACQREATPLRQLLQPYAADLQSFTVKNGRDTVLVCKNGTRLRVCANTFVTTDPEVRLEVKEVFTRAQMVAEGLSTVTTDGHLLESAGMLWVNAAPAIRADCPIQIEMPRRGLEIPVQLFDGQPDETTTRWTNPRPLANDSTWQRVERGRTLFCEYCTACHHVNLQNALTGPALGNIEQYRTWPWLLAFTRNSQRVIYDGDSTARRLWDCYKPVVMNGFEALPEADIRAIYDWIEAESARQNLHNQPDSTCAPAPKAPSSALDVRFLAFPLLRSGWVNCDGYPGESQVQLAVHVADGQTYDDLSVLLIYDQRSIQLELNKYADEFGCMPQRQAFLLPEAARLVALGVKGRDFFSADLAVEIGAVNDWTLTLQRAEPPLPTTQGRKDVPLSPFAQVWNAWNLPVQPRQGSCSGLAQDVPRHKSEQDVQHSEQ